MKSIWPTVLCLAFSAFLYLPLPLSAHHVRPHAYSSRGLSERLLLCFVLLCSAQFYLPFSVCACTCCCAYTSRGLSESGQFCLLCSTLLCST